MSPDICDPRLIVRAFSCPFVDDLRHIMSITIFTFFNQPHRALSAYMFFVQDHRDQIKSENPDVSFGEVGKLLGAKWKELSEKEKKVSPP